MTGNAKTPDEREQERKKAAIASAADALAGEFGFDAIVLLATYQNEDGDSVAINESRGNWYAQSGLMDFVRRRRGETAAIEQRELHEKDKD